MVLLYKEETEGKKKRISCFSSLFRSYNFAGFLSERQRAFISLRLASKALIIWRVSVEWQEVLDDTENQRLVDLNP